MSIFVTTFGDLLSDVTVRRPSGPVTHVKGRPVAAASSSFIIKALVQPFRADELQALPELERSSDAMKIYSEVELKTVDQVTQVAADIIEYNGYDWKVTAIDRHQEGILDHYKSIIQRTNK